jgi:hypothetical protein
MEIIHTYKSEDSEICVISDGRSIHLADKSDLTVESPKVGTVLKPSQMTEVYIEIPIPVLQEAARRSEIYVEPDAEEEESSEEEDEESEEEEEEDALAPWEPLAREKFFEEYKLLDDGVDVRVLINFPVKLQWEDGTSAIWDTSDGPYTLEEILDRQNGLRSAIEAFNARIRAMLASIATFTQDQIDIGHEMGEDTVDEFLTEELEKFNAGDAANAAE